MELAYSGWIRVTDSSFRVGTGLGRHARVAPEPLPAKGAWGAFRL